MQMSGITGVYPKAEYPVELTVFQGVTMPLSRNDARVAAIYDSTPGAESSPLTAEQIGATANGQEVVACYLGGALNTVRFIDHIEEGHLRGILIRLNVFDFIDRIDSDEGLLFRRNGPQAQRLFVGANALRGVQQSTSNVFRPGFASS